MTLRPAIPVFLLLAALCAASGAMPEWWRGDPLDSDGDGIPDEFERWSGLDAFDPADAASDRDGDGLTALEEFLGRTDPCSADTDGDYIPDGWEAANRPWADPAVFDADSDLDGDGLSLWHEWYFGSNPGNPDSNGDGRTDGEVFEAGGNPALDPAGDEAYGAVGFTVRIEGRAAARRAAVRIGPILHTGSRARRYRLPATVHAIELVDLDPASPEACAGRIVLTNLEDGAVLEGFTPEFTLAANAAPAAGGSTLEGFAPYSTLAANAAPTADGGSRGFLVASGAILRAAPACLCGDPPLVAVEAQRFPSTVPIQGTPSWSVSGGILQDSWSGGVQIWPSYGEPEPRVDVEYRFRPVGATNDFTARLTLVRHTPADPHVDGRIVCDRVPGHSKVLMLAGFQDSVPFRWVGDAAEGGNVSWTLNPSTFLQLQGNNARNVSVLGSPDAPTRATLSARTTVVLPNGKRKTLKDAIEIVTLEIAAEPITNEAGTSGDAAAVVNPSGLAVGSNATFRISYSPAQALAAGDIQWFPLEGKVSILGNQGASVRFQGATPGDETLQVDIPGFVGPPPQFRLKVFPQVDVVPVRVIIVRNDAGTLSAISPADATAKISSVNRIFAQACMRYQVTDVAYTNRSDWLDLANTTKLEEMTSSFPGNGGLKLFFVRSIADNIGGLNNSMGSVAKASSHYKVIAHEFGHASGLEDVYESWTFRIPGQSQDIQVKVPDDAVPSSDKMPLDWGNGPGPQYYPVMTSYGSGSTLHRQFIRKLLMVGTTLGSSNAPDIPLGSVHGVYFTIETAPNGEKYKHYRLGMVTVGVSAMNRQPSHE